MDELKVYFEQDVLLFDKVLLHQPTLKEIKEYSEANYLNDVLKFCATPSDEKLFLYSMGIDYNTLEEFQMFCMFCETGILSGTSILFPKTDFSKFKTIIDNETDELMLFSQEYDMTISENEYLDMAKYIRKIHGLKKNSVKDGNEYTKKWRLQHELELLEQKAELGIKDEFHSYLQPLISVAINSSGFDYNWFTIMDLPIHVFMDSIQRLQIMKNSDNLYNGIYSGNVAYKDIKNKEDLNYFKVIK